MGRRGGFLFICFDSLSLPLPPFSSPLPFLSSLSSLLYCLFLHLFPHIAFFDFPPCHSSPPHPYPNPFDFLIFSFFRVALFFPLPQVINVEQSSVSLMPCRVEISLVKADPGSWAQLEHPSGLAEKAKAGVGLEMDDAASDDSDDDLSWTEEEEEEEETMGE